MPRVTVSLGSNQDPEQHLSSCLDMLLLQFRDLALSSVFRSRAKAGRGADYLNMAVAFDTDLSVADLLAALKGMEEKHRRDRSTPDSVTLDIDLLTHGDRQGTVAGITLPRPEILTSPYVLWPLSQVAPRLRDPLSKQTYAELWRAFDQGEEAIVPVDFTWHGRVLSRAG